MKANINGRNHKGEKMDAQFTANPEGWNRFVLTVKRNFPGKNNEGLRRRIYKLADSGNNLLGLENTVALTGHGKAALRNCDAALADWDGRSANREHEVRQSLS